MGGSEVLEPNATVQSLPGVLWRIGGTHALASSNVHASMLAAISGLTGDSVPALVSSRGKWAVLILLRAPDFQTKYVRGSAA